VRPGRDAVREALALLAGLSPAAQLAAALRRLEGGGGPLASLPARGELDPLGPGRGAGDGAAPGDALDGRLLEAIAARALGGRHGAVFTPAPEARLLAAFGLAHAGARRGRLAPPDLLARLLAGAPDAEAAASLDGLAVLDPACGGGALLVAAERLARACGARLRLHGLDLSPLAARATAARLGFLGAWARVRRADATSARWPRADLVLGNPPFLRHEAIPPALKRRAAAESGLPLQADLSAHLAALALRRAPVVALVLPRAILTARSAQPFLAEAASRGGFALRLRSRAAGSFAASIDTLLVVWVAGGPEEPAAEASVPLDRLRDRELLALSATHGSRRAALRGRIAATAPGLAARRGRASPGRQEAPSAPRPGRRAPGLAEAVRLDAVCDVRFGLKTGCNAFFHLLPADPGRFRSDLLGEVALAASDVVPLLFSLREARAPELLAPSRVLFRPAGEPSPAALRYLARGEAAGVHLRPTCASRSPWWRIAPGRAPAPLLYPAKVGARAFAVLNEAGLHEDKKWHALFPRGVPAWQLALALSASPVRLAIDEGARQLTGAQAIADVDCRVLAAAPVPRPEALGALADPLAELRAALARDEVTTDLAAMLARPAQRELDLVVGRALGLTSREVERARAALRDRVAARLEHAAAVRARGGATGRAG
jgi:hypothetical protein